MRVQLGRTIKYRNAIGQRILAYKALIRFDQPVGTLLLLWPALWGVILASNGAPQLKHLAIFSLGTFLMRSAGCAINDFADRGIDGKVSRTSARPLAQGLIRPWEAVALAIVLAALAFTLVLRTNLLTIGMSFGALILASLYPFTKRWISSPQLILGAAFAWAIPMGFAAVLNKVPTEAGLLFVATLFWIVGYDTYYAMADREDDRQLNIGSMALLLGPWAAAASFAFTCLFVVGHAGVLVVYEDLDSSFLFSVSLPILFIACYQFYLARTEVPELCTKAFRLSNWIGMLITLSTLLAFQLKIS